MTWFVYAAIGFAGGTIGALITGAIFMSIDRKAHRRWH